jgi:hypothetical protein
MHRGVMFFPRGENVSASMAEMFSRATVDSPL